MNQTLASIAITPAMPTWPPCPQQFTAAGYDQFGATMGLTGTQWSATAGSIDDNGLFTAPAASGPVTVTATNGSLSDTATVTVVDTAPTVATPAAATPNQVAGNSTAMSVLGADDDGEANLTYTWTTISRRSGAATPAFSDNGDNAAKNTTATFYAAGSYSFQVTITNASELSATSSVNVTVNQTLASIAITPAMPTLTSLAQQQFAAAGYDQSGATMGLTGTTWSATAGSIDNNGLFTAPDASGAVTVTATNGSLANTTVVTVVNTAPTVATPASATPSQVAGNATALSVLGADDGGEANLTYTWTITSAPSGATKPTFSDNGDNAAKNITATFYAAGSYSFQVTISDDGGLSATSSVNVMVNQTLTSIAITPATPTLASHAQQQFAATGYDQFGATMVLTGTQWLATAGSINYGLFTAPYASGPVTVTASNGLLSNTTVVTVVNTAPTVATPAAATPSQVDGNTTALGVLGADDGGEANLTYTWTTTSAPSGAATPAFSDNGDNAAKNISATFYAAGSYSFQVTITDAGGLSATSSVDIVTVNQTLTSISNTGQPLALDQFGNPLANQPALNGNTITDSLVFDSNVTVLPAAGSQLTISGAINGQGGLTVNAPGTLVLSGTNGYTGGTTVSAGTLVLSNSSAIAAGTGLTVGAGGVFVFDPSSVATPATAAAIANPLLASSANTIAASSVASASISSVTKATTAASVGTNAVLPNLASSPATVVEIAGNRGPAQPAAAERMACGLADSAKGGCRRVGHTHRGSVCPFVHCQADRGGSGLAGADGE